MVDLNKLKKDTPIKCSEFPNQVVYFVEENYATKEVLIRLESGELQKVKSESILQMNTIFG